MSDNLMEPIRLPDPDYHRFIRDHVCAICRGHLLAQVYDDRLFEIYCPTCGLICNHNHVHRIDADVMDEAEAEMIFDMRIENQREKPPRDPDEVLKELGF